MNVLLLLLLLLLLLVSQVSQPASKQESNQPPRMDGAQRPPTNQIRHRARSLDGKGVNGPSALALRCSSSSKPVRMRPAGLIRCLLLAAASATHAPPPPRWPLHLLPLLLTDSR